jgi:hypothetical protein
MQNVWVLASIWGGLALIAARLATLVNSFNRRNSWPFHARVLITR